MSFKKLIIVGNASSVLNQKKGHIIDSFDLVLRTGSFCIKNYEQYVGTKTDLYYTPLNYFFRVCKNTTSLIFRPPLIPFNFNNLLFLETNPYEYVETSSIGTQWGVNGIPVPRAAAGELYFDKIYSSPLYRAVLQTKNNIILYEYLFNELQQRFGKFKYSFYDRDMKIALFKEFNSISTKGVFSVPSKGMYAINYAINYYKDYKIFVTGFDGLQTRNYWQSKDYEKQFDGHSTYKEKRMYKLFLKRGLIHEL